MLTVTEAKVVADLFYTLDKQVRYDLAQQRIADERDCVARLVSNFTHPFGLFNQYGLGYLRFQSKWFARVNDSYHEQTFGCDSMLVFRVGNQLKVGLFEAKWPRLIRNPSYGWDYAQESTKQSHFTDQIRRQAAWTGQAAIWETFFLEAPVGTSHASFDLQGSTCVRHNLAAQLVATQPNTLNVRWNNADLDALVQLAQGGALPVNSVANLQHIIFDMLTCQFGQPIPAQTGDTKFILKNNGTTHPSQITCPLLTFGPDDNSQPFIEDFMQTNGLTFFQQVDIIRE
jgi:hypothetical protein